MVSSKYATLLQLQTEYGLEDAYDLMEIAIVNNANEAAAIKNARSKK